MLTGLYGGTFDPVHHGHINAATAVKRFLALDEVRLVLNAQPAHKGLDCVPFENRWEMLKLACVGRDGLTADDTELRRGGRSYTFDTLRSLQQQHSDSVLCWIVGEDSFATLPSWYRWQDMLGYCNFIVLNRPGQATPLPQQVLDLCESHQCSHLDPSRSGQILKLDLPMLEISSTEIRKRIATGQCVGDMIDADVANYIRDNDLYDDHAKKGSTPLEAQ